MDEKIYGLLEKVYLELQGTKSELKQDIQGVKNDIIRLENKVDTFKAQFEEHEAKDANRHLEILEAVGEVKTELATLEEVSGKNLRDIAQLKKAK